MESDENMRRDRLLANHLSKALLNRAIVIGHILTAALYGNYEGRRFWRKVCRLFGHKWKDITDESVKSSKRCSRCGARIIEHKQYGKVKFKRYNHGAI